jgi:hypothetical protein
MGVRYAPHARPVGLSASRPRPSRRSDDGQAISCAQYGWTRNALLSRHFRNWQKHLNPWPSPRRPGGVPREQQKSCGRRPCRGSIRARRSPAICADVIPKPPVQDQMRGTGSIRLLSAPGQRERFTDRPFLPIGIVTDLLFLHFWPCEDRVPPAPASVNCKWSRSARRDPRNQSH